MALPYRLPGTEYFAGQISPGNADAVSVDDFFDDSTVVGERAAGPTARLWKVLADLLPLLVTQVLVARGHSVKGPTVSSPRSAGMRTAPLRRARPPTVFAHLRGRVRLERDRQVPGDGGHRDHRVKRGRQVGEHHSRLSADAAQQAPALSVTRGLVQVGKRGLPGKFGLLQGVLDAARHRLGRWGVVQPEARRQ